MLELISVHVPKCAGTAFRVALQQAYGAAAVHLDYGDRPLDPAAPMHLDPHGFFARSPVLPAAASVVHGHFHARKYRAITRDCPRVAILRHPVARTISHYHYWRCLEPTGGHALHAYMRAAELDLLGFSRLPFIRHAYRGVLFAGMRRSDFHFVGATETLAADMQRLSAMLGRPLGRLHAENTGPDHPEPPPSEIAALTQVLVREIAFYESWVRG